MIDLLRFCSRELRRATIRGAFTASSYFPFEGRSSSARLWVRSPRRLRRAAARSRATSTSTLAVDHQRAQISIAILLRCRLFRAGAAAGRERRRRRGGVSSLRALFSWTDDEELDMATRVLIAE